jgi:hypothetical protein
MRRRPSAATVIAMLALFVALGGPAEASRLIRGSDVKDHSLGVRDLSRKAVRTLTATRNGSITTAKIADSAVTSAKLGPASVTAPKLAGGSVDGVAIADGSVANPDLAPGAVTGDKVADGTLSALDVARFAGRFSVQVPAIHAFTCWSGEPAGLPPEAAGYDLSQDLVLVEPGSTFDQNHLSFTVRTSSNRSRFVLAACNTTASTVPAATVTYRYMVFRIP